VVDLVGSRVRVREYRPEDRDAFAALALDAPMFEFMIFRWQDELEAVREFDRIIAMDVAEPRRHFVLALERVEDGTYLGIVGMDDLGDNAAEFGWYLPSWAWGRGYAAEATELLLDFGFEDRQFLRIIAKCDPENHRSRRCLERAGLSQIADRQSVVVTWQGERPRIWFEIDRAQWTSSGRDRAHT
jgi:RimJ/RimL family protein N-acetyltransferase